MLGTLGTASHRRVVVDDSSTSTSHAPRHLVYKILCGGFRGLVHLDALVAVHLHVDDDVGLAEVVDEGRVDRLRRFVPTRVEVDLLPIYA